MGPVVVSCVISVAYSGVTTSTVTQLSMVPPHLVVYLNCFQRPNPRR